MFYCDDHEAFRFSSSHILRYLICRRCSSCRYKLKLWTQPDIIRFWHGLVLPQVLNFEIGTANIAFLFLEELWIQIKWVWVVLSLTSIFEVDSCIVPASPVPAFKCLSAGEWQKLVNWLTLKLAWKLWIFSMKRRRQHFFISLLTPLLHQSWYVP